MGATSDWLRADESKYLVRKAQRFDVWLTYFSTDREKCWMDGIFEGYYLTEVAQRFLRKRMREERTARWKVRREVLAVTSSLLFGLLGVGTNNL